MLRRRDLYREKRSDIVAEESDNAVGRSDNVPKTHNNTQKRLPHLQKNSCHNYGLAYHLKNSLSLENNPRFYPL